jgi:hypothetical protein
MGRFGEMNCLHLVGRGLNNISINKPARHRRREDLHSTNELIEKSFETYGEFIFV